MAAITWSHPEPRIRPVRPARPVRPDLRLVRPPAAPRVHPSVYRRRRLVVAVLLATLVVGAALLAGALAPGAPASGRPAAPPAAGAQVAAVHVVQPGDTVWAIARSLQPEGDVRPLVDELVAAHGGVLRIGQRIPLPR